MVNCNYMDSCNLLAVGTPAADYSVAWSFCLCCLASLLVVCFVN